VSRVVPHTDSRAISTATRFLVQSSPLKPWASAPWRRRSSRRACCSRERRCLPPGALRRRSASGPPPSRTRRIHCETAPGVTPTVLRRSCSGSSPTGRAPRRAAGDPRARPSPATRVRRPCFTSAEECSGGALANHTPVSNRSAHIRESWAIVVKRRRLRLPEPCTLIPDPFRCHGAGRLGCLRWRLGWTTRACIARDGQSVGSPRSWTSV